MFTKATIQRIEKYKNAQNAVNRLFFGILLEDDTLAEKRLIHFWIEPAEYEQLPAGTNAKRAAILVLLKNYIKDVHAAWAAETIPIKPQVLTAQDVIDDLGTNEITNLN